MKLQPICQLKSRTKLAQAKSKGLTHTLITEALTSCKCWDDIKDLLCLKICNSDIHTFVSHLWKYSRKRRNLSQAHIHHFKRGAKRCNFTNSTATIRVFVKDSEMRTCQPLEFMKGTADSCRYYKGSWETSSHTTTNNNSKTIINSECQVPWRRSLFPMSRISPYSTTLPTCMFLQVWWIWTYNSGLSRLDTTFRCTCMPSQTKIPYQAPQQINFSPPSAGQVQAQQIKVTVPPHRYGSHSCHDSYRDQYQVTS